MSLRFMKAIYKPIAVFHSTGDSFQCMRLHLTKRNHTILFQKFFWQNKFFRLYSLRIIHMNSLCIINSRNIQFLQITIHSCSLNHSGGCSITAGVCKCHVLISFFTHQSGKHTNNCRVCDHSLINLCFFKKIWFQ